MIRVKLLSSVFLIFGKDTLTPKGIVFVCLWKKKKSLMLIMLKKRREITGKEVHCFCNST